MESITIKVDDALANEIEKSLKPYYSTKTEFIREAIRDKLKEIKKEKALLHFKNNFGKSKIKTTLNEEHKKQEKAIKSFAKKILK